MNSAHDIAREKEDKVIDCRVLRHAWEEVHVGPLTTYNEIMEAAGRPTIQSRFPSRLVRICACERCGTMRVDWYPLGAELRSLGVFKPFHTRMVYDAGYQVKGQGRAIQYSDAWHREFMRRRGVNVK